MSHQEIVSSMHSVLLGSQLVVYSSGSKGTGVLDIHKIHSGKFLDSLGRDYALIFLDPFA